MTKLLVCKIKETDGSEYIIKTYTDNHILPRLELCDVIPLQCEDHQP